MTVVRRLFAAVALLAPLLAVTGAANASPNVVVAARNQFAPAEVVMAEGTGLTFANTDAVPHDVTAMDTDGSGAPLFRSDTILAGTAAVEGVEDLEPNTYSFFCTVHPDMWGLLTVVDTPDAVDDVVDEPPVSPPPVANALGVAVPTPTSLAFAPAGDALFVTSWALGSVFRLPVLPGGLLGPAVEHATGFESPLGVAVDGAGTLYVADSYPSTRPGRDRDGRVWALPATGGAAGSVGSVVVSELPNGRHNTNNLVVHGNRLYVTNGNSTDDGVSGGQPEEPPWSGALLSVPLSGRGLTPSSSAVVVEATGMRNLYDVAIRPGTREAWIATNGPDALDPFGEDLLLRATVSDPADTGWTADDFGFPGCVYRDGGGGSAVAGQNTAVASTHPCSPSHRPPEQLLGLHVSADGVAFGPGPQSGFWGGDLFVAEFGSFNGVTGHKVVRVPVDAAGVSGRPVDFFVGAAPLDLAFGPPGTGLYVADFATGQITLLRAPAA